MPSLQINKGTNTDDTIYTYQVTVTDERLPNDRDWLFAVDFDLTVSADDRLQKIQSESERYIAKWLKRLGKGDSVVDPVLST